MKEKNTGVLRLVLRVLQGMLIGVGAVLPGISGGVGALFAVLIQLLADSVTLCMQ